jgi:hypothetical protein
MERPNYPVRWTKLDEQGEDREVDRMSPEERLAMVWTLTLQAWSFREGWVDEQRLRRDVVRVLRDGG